MNSDPAWAILLGGALAYNLIAGRHGGELLSTGAARHRAAHPLLITLFIVATIGHLAGWTPKYLDPYHIPFRSLGARRGTR